MSKLTDNDVLRFVQNFNFSFTTNRIIIQGLFITGNLKKENYASKMITHAWVGSDFTFHLRTKKVVNLAKIVNMNEFIKMMRFPHEYIKIYYR